MRGIVPPAHLNPRGRCENEGLIKRLVIVRTATGFCANVPDLPGCLATGATEAETRRLIEEGIEFHVEGLRLEGFPVPPPTTTIGYAEVA